MGTHIMCSGIDSMDTLRLPFQYLRDYSVTRLLLTNLNFTVPGDVFWGLRMDTLKVVDSSFGVSSPTEGVHALASRVRNLELMRSTVDMGSSPLTNMNKLESLYVQKSSVEKCGRQWMAALVNLSVLAVDSSTFHALEADALSDASNLVRVTWTNNDLRSVRRSFLPLNGAHLKAVDLSDNRLSSLPDDIFSNMPVLETVVLSRNDFKVLSEQPWIPVLNQLRAINIDGNPLVCNSTSAWLMRRDVRDKVSGTCSEPPQLRGRRLATIDPIWLQS